MFPQKTSGNCFLVALSFSLLSLVGCEVDEDITLSALSIPDIPKNLAISDITSSSLVVRWNPADAHEAVKNYFVYQNNVQVAADSSTTYLATGLESESDYTFSVRAINIANNISDFSTAVSVKTIAEEESTPEKVRILVFTKTSEFRHTSIENGVTTFIDLGTQNNFDVVHTESATDFNTANLNEYKTVVFLNTTGDILDESQQEAFENYIQAGGSFMGVHAATDTEYDWSWYGQLVGAYFDDHPDIQNARMNIVDSSHQATEHLDADWIRTDEWYNFKEVNSNINVLLNLDEASYQGGTNGENHPIAWYHEFDGGRSFYTGGGHTEASYDEPNFQQHLLGGIIYCLGRDKPQDTFSLVLQP